MAAGPDDRTVELKLDLPSSAPAEPPRILKRPSALAPPVANVVPRAVAPHSALAPITDPRAEGLPTRSPISSEDPTLVRPSPRPAAVPLARAPDVVEPRVVEPRVVEPRVVEPRVVEPRVVEPRDLEPRAAPPRAVEPRPVEARAPSTAPSTAPRPAAPRASAPSDDGSPSTREPERSATDVTAPRAGAAPAAVLVMPGIGRWLGATFVDVVLGGAVVTGALVGALASRGVRVAWQPVVDFVHLDLVTGIATLLVPPLLALIALQLVSVLALGASIGQRLAGLRVARVFDGAKPGLARVTARALAGSLGVLALGVGPLWGLWMDRRRRGLGDLVARTIVVRRSTSTTTARGDR